MLLTAMATFPKSSAVFRESMQRWISDKLWIKSMMTRRMKVPRSKLLFCVTTCPMRPPAFYTSPFEEAAILTVDGAGEWTTSTMGIGRGKKVDIKKEIRFPHSLGLLYSAFTAYCGFEINEGEYKLMGMHPYGEPKYVDKIYEILKVGEDGSLFLDMRYFQYHYSTTTPCRRNSSVTSGVRAGPKDQDTSLDPYSATWRPRSKGSPKRSCLRMVTQPAQAFRGHEEPVPVRRCGPQLGGQLQDHARWAL